MELEKLEKALSINFSDKQLLKQAFTHSSYVNEHQKNHLSDNERLEFLGDAVLELATSDYLYNECKQMSEGELTKLRASIVCEESLYRFAEILGLRQYVLLGKGEERTGGRNRQALLADIFESFLGALYLDQGMDACQAFLERRIFPHIETDAFSHVMDYKTKLQEVIQSERGNTLEYRIIEEKGPAHRKEFLAEVIVNGKKCTRGTGNSKKSAEQFAAKQMLDELNRENG